MASLALTPGARLGRYVLHEEIGRGAMGVVWSATLTGLHGFSKAVALKTMRRDQEMPDTVLLREARLGAGLSHPNVVSILDLGRASGWVYLAMERVNGPSLASLMATGPLPPPACIEIGRQVCAALAHVHQAGLVHRDVKPSNLLLDPSGLVKLVDLGVAALQGERVQGAGTLGYAPAEQLEGRGEARSDLFALGVVIATLALGWPPLGRGPRAADAIYEVERVLGRGQVPQALDRLLPGLGHVVVTCLKADPAERWSSAVELSDALGELVPQTRSTALVELAGGDAPSSGSDTFTDELSDDPTMLRPRSLPHTRDRYVGRDEEHHLVLGHIAAGVRLISLTGLGGMGKTRLAEGVGHRVDRAVVWVDLVAARSAADLQLAVLHALRLPASTDVGVQAREALRSHGRCLVVLDNLEQIVSDASPVVSSWLDEVPEATFLATSQIPLGLRGEKVVPVGPLGLQAAVELFLERAPRPLSRSESLEKLMAELDHLPLAIELAAAHTRLIGVDEIRARLGRQLMRMSGGQHRPSRHRTLSASLDASMQLLEPVSRAVLAQVSVFEDGFDIAQVESVLDLSDWPDAPWVVEVIEDLVLHSLVSTDGTRLRLLRVVREYARGLLEPEERLALMVRYEAAFTWWGSEEAAMVLDGPRAVEHLDRLLEQRADLTAACRHALGRGAGDVALRLARGLEFIYRLQGPFREGARLLEQVNALVPNPRLMLATGNLLVRAGDMASAKLNVVSAHRAFRAAGDGRGQALAIAELGYLCFAAGQVDEAARHYAKALEQLDPDDPAMARVQASTGLFRMQVGDSDGARSLLEESLRLHRRAGRVGAVARTLGNLARVHHARGEVQEAERCFREALRGLRHSQNHHSEAMVRGNYANLLRWQGRFDEARVQYQRALSEHRRIGNLRSEGNVLGNLGNLHRETGDLELAREHYEAAIDVHQRCADPMGVAIVTANLGMVFLESGELARSRATLRRALGLQQTHGSPRTQGFAWRSLTDLELAVGDLAAAQAACDRALELHLEVGDRMWAGWDRVGLAQVALRRDDAELALALLDATKNDLDGTQCQAPRDLAYADALSSCGRSDEAVQRLERAEQAATPHEQLPVRLCEARVRLRLGDHAGAQHALKHAKELASGLAAGAPLALELVRTEDLCESR